MSEAFTVMKPGDADRRLLLKLQPRLLQTPPADHAMPQTEDRLTAMVFALAPMTLAFLYLMILSLILFR